MPPVVVSAAGPTLSVGLSVGLSVSVRLPVCLPVSVMLRGAGGARRSKREREGLVLTDTTIALPLSQSMQFARVTDGSADDVLSEACVYEAVASVVHGSDATVLALGHRRAIPKWEGMDMSGLAPAAIRMLLRMSNGHRRMLLRAARSNTTHSHQERLNPAVEPLLLRQLWSAIHSKRQLFGQTVQGPSSFSRPLTPTAEASSESLTCDARCSA